MQSSEINEVLQYFLLEAKKVNGVKYPSQTMYYLLIARQGYIRAKSDDNKKGFRAFVFSVLLKLFRQVRSVFDDT